MRSVPFAIWHELARSGLLVWCPSGERVVIRVPLATVALAVIWGVFVAGAAWLAYESASAIGVALGTCIVVVGIVLVVRAVRSSLVGGDPYTYAASATATGLAEHKRQAAALARSWSSMASPTCSTA